jgi:hypothetical protein
LTVACLDSLRQGDEFLARVVKDAGQQAVGGVRTLGVVANAQRDRRAAGEGRSSEEILT